MAKKKRRRTDEEIRERLRATSPAYRMLEERVKMIEAELAAKRKPATS